MSTRETHITGREPMLATLVKQTPPLMPGFHHVVGTGLDMPDAWLQDEFYLWLQYHGAIIWGDDFDGEVPFEHILGHDYTCSHETVGSDIEGYMAANGVLYPVFRLIGGRCDRSECTDIPF